MEKEKIIDVNNLSYSYGSGQLIKSLSFKIERGDFAGLIGGNGSGKTTLLNLLLGRLPALSGSIKLFGTDLSRFRSWSKLGYVPQKASNINPDFPIHVEELVALPLSSVPFALRNSRKSIQEKVEKALLTVGMNEFRKRQIGKLSGGQQQRVFIAKALVTEPELLLLDEPTVGIDHEAESEIYGLLHELNLKRQMTILWVSHDIAAVSAMTNRLLCIGPDGFFEHTYEEGKLSVDVQKLYAYEVMAHHHSHS